MKTKLFAFIAAVALVVGVGQSRAASVSVSVFYESLEPYGEWMDTNDYGYIWHPRDVDDSWRPYTVGNWAYTDAGWTWVSEEPFGWATYHYGRWVEIDRIGWSWVPDREWGPAWVSWRRSDRYVGWAPLPPEARFEARVGIHEWSDSYYDIGPASYSFVSVRNFGAPRLRTVLVEPRENVTIINETRNITRITYVNNIVINNGPEYDVVVRESAQPIRRLKLERRTDMDFRPGADRASFKSQMSGETLRVAAPEIQISRDVTPKKVARKLERVDVNRGWSKIGDPQATERLRAKFATEARPPADLPPLTRGPAGSRSADRERPATSATGADRPSAPATAEVPTRERDTKPGAKSADAEAKPSADRPKSGNTADQPKPGVKESPTAREEREKARTPGAVQTPTAREPESGVARKKTAPESDQPDKPTAQPKTSPDKKAEASTPGRPGERPDPAVAREEKSKRPEARTQEPQLIPEPRPESEKPKKRENPEAEKPARAAERAPGDRPSKEKPAADRPGLAIPEPAERPARPDSVDRPDRKDPSLTPGDRGSQPPPTKQESAPDRVKPERANRSPENRPPAPDAGFNEAIKKGSKDADKKPERAERPPENRPSAPGAGPGEAPKKGSKDGEKRAEKDEKKDN